MEKGQEGIENQYYYSNNYYYSNYRFDLDLNRSMIFNLCSN